MEDMENKEALVKQAIDALSQLDKDEQTEAFNYFQSLIHLYNGSNRQ